MRISTQSSQHPANDATIFMSRRLYWSKHSLDLDSQYCGHNDDQ